MIIPKSGKERDKFVKFIIDTCGQSRDDRVSLYARRRRYFLYGSSNAGGSLLNRLSAHLDLVASFLYSPDHAQFAVSPPEHAEDHIVEQTISLSRYWNDTFRDSDLAYQYGEALRWATVYDTMFIKMGWNNARAELFGHTVSPNNIGVWDESRPGLDNQSAFVHSYNIDYDEAVQRLYRAGLASEIKRLNVDTQRTDSDAPPVLQNLILGGAWGPSITDPIQGIVNTNAEPVPSYAAQNDAPTVKWNEAYIWDNQHDDWTIITAISPDIIISDSRETIEALAAANRGTPPPSGSNLFLPEEHPFVEVQPYELYDYFWGEAHIEKLIPLQNWSDKRLSEIQQLLARQVNPSKFGSGMMGLTDEAMAAMSGPGAWAFEQVPGAKIEELKPEIPPDLFAEFREIKAAMLEASGLTETLEGRGEQGVRGRGHARQLAVTGSGRIRKVAVGLEKSLAKLGDIGMKLLMRNSEQKLRTATRMDFVPAQASGDYRVRIAGHSHSPLFRDETREDAIVMLKAQAIGKEELIDMLNPPNAVELKHRLKQRMAAQAKAAQEAAARGEELPQQGGGKKPNLKVVGS